MPKLLKVRPGDTVACVPPPREYGSDLWGLGRFKSWKGKQRATGVEHEQGGRGYDGMLRPVSADDDQSRQAAGCVLATGPTADCSAKECM